MNYATILKTLFMEKSTTESSTGKKSSYWYVGTFRSYFTVLHLSRGCSKAMTFSVIGNLRQTE